MLNGHTTLMQFLDTDLIYRRLIYGDHVVAVFFFFSCQIVSGVLDQYLSSENITLYKYNNFFFTPCPLKLNTNWRHADYLQSLQLIFKKKNGCIVIFFLYFITWDTMFSHVLLTVKPVDQSGEALFGSIQSQLMLFALSGGDGQFVAAVWS